MRESDERAEVPRVAASHVPASTNRANAGVGIGVRVAWNFRELAQDALEVLRVRAEMREHETDGRVGVELLEVGWRSRRNASPLT